MLLSGAPLLKQIMPNSPSRGTNSTEQIGKTIPHPTHTPIVQRSRKFPGKPFQDGRCTDLCEEVTKALSMEHGIKSPHLRKRAGVVTRLRHRIPTQCWNHSFYSRLTGRLEHTGSTSFCLKVVVCFTSFRNSQKLGAGACSSSRIETPL